MCEKAFHNAFFSERDIAMHEDGSENSLNAMLLTEEDVRKTKEEENFENFLNENNKITAIEDIKSFEEEGTETRRSNLYFYFFIYIFIMVFSETIVSLFFFIPNYLQLFTYVYVYIEKDVFS